MPACASATRSRRTSAHRGVFIVAVMKECVVIAGAAGGGAGRADNLTPERNWGRLCRPQFPSEAPLPAALVRRCSILTCINSTRSIGVRARTVSYASPSCKASTVCSSCSERVKQAATKVSRRRQCPPRPSHDQVTRVHVASDAPAHILRQEREKRNEAHIQQAIAKPEQAVHSHLELGQEEPDLVH